MQQLIQLDCLPCKHCQYRHIRHLNLVILDTRIQSYYTLESIHMKQVHEQIKYYVKKRGHIFAQQRFS